MVIVEKHNGPIFPKAKNLKKLKTIFLVCIIGLLISAIAAKNVVQLMLINLLHCYISERKL